MWYNKVENGIAPAGNVKIWRASIQKSIADGTIPHQITQNLGRDTNMPISGYTEDGI